ncbi:hypothetical protein ACFLWA_06980 [Chloroflexota bacterium]
MTEEKKTSGWIVFASIMMFGLGGITLLAGIADFSNSAWMQNLSILGDNIDASYFGILDLIIALSCLYAAMAIWRGTRGGYWLGLIFSTLSMLRWFLLMPGAPIWSLTMAAVWCMVAYGLATNADHFQPGAAEWAGKDMVEAEKRHEQL